MQSSLLLSRALFLLLAVWQVDSFCVSTGNVALLRPQHICLHKHTENRAEIKRHLGLRMTEKGDGQKDSDPYVVKPQVPSFAKEENQWELDTQAAAEAGDQSKRIIAITTGAFAMVISVLYLFAVFALESRGDMKPAPPEAYGAFVFDHASSVLLALAKL